MTRFCPECGKKIADHVKFCPECGMGLNGKSTVEPEKLSCEQPVAFVARSSFFERNKKNLLVIAFAVAAVLGCCAGGYTYYQNQKVAAAQAEAEAEARAAQKAEDDRKAAEKAAAEKKMQEQHAKVRAGLSNALGRLQHNEEMLKDMADKLNSGTYDSAYFNMKRSSFYKELLAPVDELDTIMAGNDNTAKSEVKALIEIQRVRANMMYQGLNGDSSKFATGDQYYGDYYAKLNAFKTKYNL